MTPRSSRREFLAGSATAVAAVGMPAQVRGSQGDALETDGGFEEFADDAVENALADHDAAGAVVSIVHDGSVALTKGYGETTFSEASVTADETPIHTGSISKLLTYTTAMQLIDDGEVDADEPVNRYLETVSVPDGPDEPITVTHLATHTPGFEIRARNDTVSNIGDRQSLAKAVGSSQPGRIRPPGERLGYTNYAAALTGQLVADVTGRSFEGAVRESVFEPLGMDRSTFAAVPETVTAETRDGIVEELSWHSNVPPASGLWSTGTDMARFMLAHLEGGATDAGRMLSPDATKAMHAQWYTPHEEVDCMAFGFFERTRDDVRLLFHSGGGPGYGSQLVLAPELDLALFVSFQGGNPSPAASSVEDEFLDHYVPTTDAQLTPAGRPERADELEGSYRAFPALEHSSYEKALFTLQLPDVEVRIDDEGALLTETGDVTRWIEIEPLVFRREDGQRTLVFHEENEKITGFTAGGQSWAFSRRSWYDDLSIHTGLALGSSLVVLSGLVGWPLAAAVRRYRGSGSSSGRPRQARWIAGIAGGLFFGFIVSLVALVLLLPAIGAPSIFDRPPNGFAMLFGLPLLAAGATLAAVGYALEAWHKGYWSLVTRLHYTVFVGCLVGLVWVFHYWNLLGIPR